MIQIQFILAQKNQVIHAVSVQGHAYYEQKGQDIVCAAFSCLLRTFYGLVQQCEGFERQDWKEGLVELVLKPEIEGLEQMKNWTEFFLMGVQDLVYEFPKNIKVNYQEVINGNA